MKNLPTYMSLTSDPHCLATNCLSKVFPQPIYTILSNRQGPQEGLGRRTSKGNTHSTTSVRSDMVPLFYLIWSYHIHYFRQADKICSEITGAKVTLYSSRKDSNWHFLISGMYSQEEKYVQALHTSCCTQDGEAPGTLTHLFGKYRYCGVSKENRSHCFCKL